MGSLRSWRFRKWLGCDPKPWHAKVTWKLGRAQVGSSARGPQRSFSQSHHLDVSEALAMPNDAALAPGGAALAETPSTLAEQHARQEAAQAPPAAISDAPTVPRAVWLPEGVSVKFATPPAAPTVQPVAAPAAAPPSAILQHVPMVLMVITTIGFVGLIFTMMVHEVPEKNSAFVEVMGGSLMAAFTMIVSYYFGSSSSSKVKDQTISSLVNEPQPATAPVVLAQRKTP